MNDLRSHLSEIAGPPVTSTSDQFEADLLRGRRALRRRRAGQSAVAGAFVVAVAAAAISFVPRADTTDPTPAVPAVAAIQLVAYKGSQPKGFTVDKVPDGWFIQGDDTGTLVLAPKRIQNPGPDAKPSTDPIYAENSFVDKIVIMLESVDQSGPGDRGRPVQVGDKPGVLVKSEPAPRRPQADPAPGSTEVASGLTEADRDRGSAPADPAAGSADGAGAEAGDTGWSLWVKQPSGVYLIVQFWAGVGLTEAQMLELGAGVHVHKDAVQGHG